MKTALLALTVAFVASLFASCIATSSDLHDLANDFASFEEGAIDADALADAIDAKADEIEARATELVDSMPTTPAGWIALLAQMGTAAVAGGYGVNRYRNNKRTERGEAV